MRVFGATQMPMPAPTPEPPTHWEPSGSTPGQVSASLAGRRPILARLRRAAAACMDGQGSTAKGLKAEADLEMPAMHFALRLDRKGMKRNAARSVAFFTERSLAAYLAVSDRTIRNWIRRGELPSYKLGAARRIDPADVDAFLAQRRDEAA